MREWLKRIRLSAGITQGEVAKAAAITANAYCMIEIGKRNASVKTAKCIASALNFPWTQFFEQ